MISTAKSRMAKTAATIVTVETQNNNMLIGVERIERVCRGEEGCLLSPPREVLRWMVRSGLRKTSKDLKRKDMV